MKSFFNPSYPASDAAYAYDCEWFETYAPRPRFCADPDARDDDAIEVTGEFARNPLTRLFAHARWVLPEGVSASSVWEYIVDRVPLDNVLGLLTCGEGGGVAILAKDWATSAVLRTIAWQVLYDAAKTGDVVLYSEDGRIDSELFARANYVLSPRRTDTIEPNPAGLTDEEFAALFKKGADRRRIAGVCVDQASLAAWIGKGIAWDWRPLHTMDGRLAPPRA